MATGFKLPGVWLSWLAMDLEAVDRSSTSDLLVEGKVGNRATRTSRGASGWRTRGWPFQQVCLWWFLRGVSDARGHRCAKCCSGVWLSAVSPAALKIASLLRVYSGARRPCYRFTESILQLRQSWCSNCTRGWCLIDYHMAIAPKTSQNATACRTSAGPASADSVLSGRMQETPALRSGSQLYGCGWRCPSQPGSGCMVHQASVRWKLSRGEVEAWLRQQLPGAVRGEYKAPGTCQWHQLMLRRVQSWSVAGLARFGRRSMADSVLRQTTTKTKKKGQ